MILQFRLEMFAALADVIKIDGKIIDKTIQIRKVRKILLPDAIIAATAIIHSLTLVTNNNTKDFVNIKSLKVLNPYKI
jgi:predicted nucleic acid-binding protein